MSSSGGAGGAGTGIEPDTKDWTWVLDRPCEECGFDASTVARHELPTAFRRNAAVWLALLADPAVCERTRPDRWSTLEYACHVHDVHHVFHDRVALMLAEDEPRFANWDQDEAAVAGRYDDQLASIVAPTLVTAAYAVSDLYASVPPLSWQRRGFRSNGSEFTIESLGRYHLHDVVHHLHDVESGAAAATIRAYDAFADDYGAGAPPMPPSLAAAISRLAEALGPGARVLEIGSGHGRDALALEAAGLRVRRTDVTPAFVDALRAQGFAADVLDPLSDDLTDPVEPGTPYDGVWANACLLHVDRDALPTVLARLRGVTRPGGLVFASVKEGDGEEWSVHGHVAAPRRFVYWREPELRQAFADAGWRVEAVEQHPGSRDELWLQVTAARAD